MRQETAEDKVIERAISNPDHLALDMGKLACRLARLVAYLVLRLAQDEGGHACATLQVSAWAAAATAPRGEGRRARVILKMLS
jgi:hypothetical protein